MRVFRTKIIRFRSQKSAALAGEWGALTRVSAYVADTIESAMAQVPPFTNVDPQTAAILGAAYDEALARLLDQPDVVRELVARRLVALATRGERNIYKLCDEALIAEGFLN